MRGFLPLEGRGLARHFPRMTGRSCSLRQTAGASPLRTKLPAHSKPTLTGHDPPAQLVGTLDEVELWRVHRAQDREREVDGLLQEAVDGARGCPRIVRDRTQRSSGAAVASATSGAAPRKSSSRNGGLSPSVTWVVDQRIEGS